MKRQFRIHPLEQNKINKVWPFTFNLLVLAAGASVAPFIVLYYQALGFTGGQIGLLTGIVPLITFFAAPLWTGFADTTHRHRPLLGLAILASACALFVFPLLSSFPAVMLLAVGLFFFVAPLSPFADSATMFMLGGEKEKYGRIRLGGTIGFGLAAPIAGALVQDHGLKLAFWIGGALLLLSLFAGRKLSFGSSQPESPAIGQIRTLLANPRWLLFLVLAFAGGSALAAFETFLFPYMKELKASETMMGFALTIGTIAEIPILYFGDRLIRRLKSHGLMMLSMIVTGLRLLLFAASGSALLILLIQLLNGLTFPAMWVAGVSFADENAPPGMRTTAQGLFNAMSLGFGLAVGGFVGGPLLEGIGGRGLYLIFGTVVLLIAATVALIQRSLPAAEVVSPETIID
jgi:PPP family 3-phenylpropionic acid transporter